jgi:hypothetical protein
MSHMQEAETVSHMQEAEHYLMQAEEIRTAHRHTGDRNAAAVPLAMIAQTHATLALVQTLNDMRDDNNS